MAEPRSGDADGSGATGDGAPDPFRAFVAHAGAMIAEARLRLTMGVDEALGKVYRLVFLALALLMALAIAFVAACCGGYHLITGLVMAIESWTGSAWAAHLIVGGLCIAVSAALVGIPFQRVRAKRIERLRAKYGAAQDEA
jgi:hypothetical protein